MWPLMSTRSCRTPSGRRVEVFCQHGLAWLDDDYGGPLHVETSAGAEVLTCAPPAWVDDIPVPDHPVAVVIRHYAEANRSFLDALAAGRPPTPGIGDALTAHRVV